MENAAHILVEALIVTAIIVLKIGIWERYVAAISTSRDLNE